MNDPSNQSVETVLVQADAGPMRVNRADYENNPDVFGALIDDNGDRKSTATLVADMDAELTDAERSRAAELGVLIGGNWKPSTARRKIEEAENARNGSGTDSGEYDVVERNGRHFVVDKGSNAVKLNQDGYASSVEAWTAVSSA